MSVTKPSDAESERRAELIDLEIDGVITPDQAAELARLQAACDAYLDATTPIELENLEWLEARVAELKGGRN